MAANKIIRVVFVPSNMDDKFNFSPQEGAEKLEELKRTKKVFRSYGEVAKALSVGQRVIVGVSEMVKDLGDMLLGYGEVERTEDGYHIYPKHLMMEF